MDVPIPNTAAQLQQFLWSSRWMAKSIPEYDKLTILLQSMLTTAMSGLPQRTKRAAATRHLSKFGWNQEHTNAFESLTKARGDQTILNYPDPNRGERLRFLFKGYHWEQSLNRWGACPHRQL